MAVRGLNQLLVVKSCRFGMVNMSTKLCNKILKRKKNMFGCVTFRTRKAGVFFLFRVGARTSKNKIYNISVSLTVCDILNFKIECYFR